MKTLEIREKKVDELKKMILDLRKELFNLRFQRASSQVQDTSRFRKVRRDIARIKTVLSEKFAVQSQGAEKKTKG